MNPAEEFLAEKSKTASKRAEDDLQLWHAWNNAGRTPDTLEPLLKRYDSVFNRKSHDWKAPSVSPSAFKAELMQHFIVAAQSFDPERGVAFNTHVQNRLKKAQRYNSRYQNIGYIPEDQARYIGPLRRAQNELTDNLGREPTHAELATQLGLPVKRVTTLISVIKKDVPSSHYESDPSAFTTTRESDVVRLMQKRPDEYLNPQEVTVFNHVYGVNGARKLTDTTGLASQLGLSQPKVSRLKTSIADKIKKHM